MKISLNQTILKFMTCFMVFIFLLVGSSCSNKDESRIYDSERIEYGRKILESSLNELGTEATPGKNKIKLSVNPELLPSNSRFPESYSISVDSIISINGFDAAGVMYGCLDLANRIKQNNKLNIGMNINESPLMKLRGVCILLMKLGTYNYPLTPSEYPFFYNKKQWIDYLDFLAQNRFNYIAIWNGHPFDYFVKLDKYPEAQDGLSPQILKQNHDMLKWLIGEGAKRNIKFVFEFYNVHTSVYYRKAHNLPEEISKPTKELADYTSYCIEKFVNEFPEVGLYITAGEALDKKYSVSWVNDVILSSIKQTGKKPLVFLRSWFLNLEDARKIVGNYPDLYIESKYNVEMVADTLVDPLNKEWDALTGNFIVNIHMAGNLEPFRWNPPLYIQKCMQSSYKTGAEGLHLYPRKSWRWPNVSEVGSNQLQWERDELWFKMWGRYSWNSFRNEQLETDYWQRYLADKYGSAEAAVHFLNGFNLGADVLPALQRLLWAGDDNHTVMTSGLMLSQLERAPGIPFLSLDPVERIPDFLDDLVNRMQSGKISPIKFMQEKMKSAEKAVEEMRLALRFSQLNKDEAENYLRDAEATLLTIQFYYAKLQAVSYFALYKADINTAVNSKKFLEQLKLSVQIYQNLASKMDGYYDSISDVSASHPVPLKKVPFHWNDLLPFFREEYKVYSGGINQTPNSSNRNPVYKGLAGILYGDPNLVKPKIILNTDKLAFDWNNNPPDDGRNWSVLLNGFIKAPVTGEVKFYTASSQKVILSIEGRKILEKEVNPQQSSASINMIKGKWYPLSVEYENVDYKGSNLVIEWSWNGEQRKGIAAEYLMHSENDANRAKRAIVLGF